LERAARLEFLEGAFGGAVLDGQREHPSGRYRTVKHLAVLFRRGTSFPAMRAGVKRLLDVLREHPWHVDSGTFGSTFGVFGPTDPDGAHLHLLVRCQARIQFKHLTQRVQFRLDGRPSAPGSVVEAIYISAARGPDEIKSAKIFGDKRFHPIEELPNPDVRRAMRDATISTLEYIACQEIPRNLPAGANPLVGGNRDAFGEFRTDYLEGLTDSDYRRLPIHTTEKRRTTWSTVVEWAADGEAYEWERAHMPRPAAPIPQTDVQPYAPLPPALRWRGSGRCIPHRDNLLPDARRRANPSTAIGPRRPRRLVASSGISASNPGNGSGG
jgi:hypothetical protein